MSTWTGLLPVLSGVGPSALLAVVVLMILTGLLVTRRQLRDVQADRDFWREAATEWQKVATQHGMTLERLVVTAETSSKALSEMQSVVVPAARDGGAS